MSLFRDIIFRNTEKNHSLVGMLNVDTEKKLVNNLVERRKQLASIYLSECAHIVSSGRERGDERESRFN